MKRKEALALLLVILLLTVPLYMRVYMRLNIFSLPKTVKVAAEDKPDWEQEQVLSEESAPETAPKSTGIYYPVAEFIVNIAHTEAQRFLKVKIILELDNKKTKKELDEKTAMMRDTVLSILSSKDFPQLDSEKGKEDLRIELIDAINTKLEKGKIINLYFQDFVAQ